MLSSILSQNPQIYAGPNSPMCGMMFNLERSILASEQYSAFPKPEVMPATVMGVIDGFYSDIEQPIIIDKSREWSVPEHFQVLVRNLPYEPRIIMPVRSVIEILASFIDLVHRNPSSTSFIDNEIEGRQEFNFYRPADDIRCDHLMRPKGLIDNVLYGIAASMQPENAKYFHLVEYNNILSNPQHEIENIYKFMGVEPFEHDFNNIENNVPEDDKQYGLRGMHDVRSKLGRRDIDPAKVLSPYVLQKYSNAEFWRGSNATD